MKNIYVGNLSYSTMEQDLEAAFSQFGQVDRVSVVRDRDTGQPRGFAFVEMSDDQSAQTAIERMNGADLHGRTLTVNEARPRPAGGGFGGGAGRGPGGGGGRGGYGGGGGGNRSGGGGGGAKRREPRW